MSSGTCPSKFMTKITGSRVTVLLLGMLAGHVIHMGINLILQPKYTALPGAQVIIKPKNIRVLCYINTFPANYELKAIHVYYTWARRCTKIWFTSTKPHRDLPIMILNLTVPETRMHLWSKMRRILRQLYMERNNYDYFFKADDDTYAVMENLHLALAENSPDKSFMTGFRWNILCPGGYFSGGSGYVLSRQALTQIVEQAIDKHPNCPTYDEDKEDVKMCLCGRAVGVDLIDKFGPSGLSLFYPYSLDEYFKMPNRKKLLQLNEAHVSFHYVEPKWMYIKEYLIYALSREQAIYCNETTLMW
ncbi:Glycoprotein-N-acetylgalactosamine 3-beta-galactosyltransferase [Fasciola gigantica]|uniref:Glycoprotein-N-acetylgalactosamine 3-beta-galactosyltransferase n=1 Tax=Fasciola gigantica TaxID=46835 RepID=A0A504YPA8_FASGI|nr:Glycoprotein-N-acetylgalactosamine 3-beta-galactosyltransferase [Fasciola gigantica]